MKMESVTELVREIKESLAEFIDEKRISFAAKCYPTHQHVMGVTVPNLKAVLKELKKEVADFPFENKMEILRAMVAENIFELQQMAYEYMRIDKSLLLQLSEDHLDELAVNLDNWLSVDTYSAVVGLAWSKSVISMDKIEKYLHQKDFWFRRIGVVSTVYFNQQLRGDQLDFTIKVCEKVVGDHEKNMVKALSWALREVVKYDSELVVDFLAKHEDSLHKQVIREVNKKLYTGLKN